MPADSRFQERVFAFLTDPATHSQLRRIDTHAASVFLESERALKVKRAIRFPYLDYSTLAKRRAACEQEITINRRFAPQIYRRVVPITENNEGELSIGGEGTPVEFAIEMARFDERRTIDHLAEAGPLPSDLIEAIADAIVASHLAAPPVAAGPWIQSIPGILAGNTAAFRAATCFPERDIGQLEDASHSALSRICGLLEQRGSADFVRQCHGDLHLANIVLIEDQPVLFDAIEFDPTIASTDVLYDPAFPLMDFLRYNRHAGANSLMNRYLSTSPLENLDALGALPLFMSLRAGIRANVMLARLGPACRDDANIRQSAHVYFELALRLIQPAAPRLVAVGGLSGTGKSVLARALAPSMNPDPGAVVVRSDVLRKRLLHVSETDRLPEGAYRPEITRQIYDMLGQHATRVLSQGHSAVVDAVFADQSERTAIRNDANRLGAKFIGLYLQTDLATRQRRIGARGRDASDATPEIAALQEKFDIGAVDWTLIDASGTPEQTLKLCQSAIAGGETR